MNKSYKQLYKLHLFDEQVTYRVAIRVKVKEPFISNWWRKTGNKKIIVGFRKCILCKKRVTKENAYTYGCSRKGHRLTTFCTKECHQKFFEKLQELQEIKAGKEICSIIKEHEEKFSKDPEHIDIKKFLNKYVECK